MYKILIVDDEEVEREGIKFLINKYKIELDIAEATNGEKALEYLRINHADILFTDIKMPFMDGLDLSHEDKKIKPKIKIVIFSAYDEFDYAKRAIENDTFRYLLKPVEIEEFLDVIHNIMDICSKEEEEEKKTKEISDSYRQILIYEKEKLLLNIINSEAIDDSFKKRIELINLELNDKYVNMLMINTKNRFFNLKNDEFEKLLENIIEYYYEYINLNEYQKNHNPVLLFLVFFKNLQFKKKLFISYLVVIIIPIIVLGSYSYIQSKRFLLNEEKQGLSELVRQISENLNYKFERYNTVISFLVFNSQIIQIVNNQDADYFNKYVNMSEILDPLINTVLNINEDMSKIFIYTNNGNLTERADSNTI